MRRGDDIRMWLFHDLEEKRDMVGVYEFFVFENWDYALRGESFIFLNNKKYKNRHYS